MSQPLTNNLNFNQNQAENLVLQNLVGAPSNPVPGQIYYDSTGLKQRAYYYSPTGNAGAPGWILLDTPTIDVDNYVDSVEFNTGSGTLTLGRTNALPDLSTSLDGRYLRGNETITLSGDITGSGATSISTTLQAVSITGKPDATLGTNSIPTGVTYFLVSQDGALKKYSSTSLQTYINSLISASGYIDEYTVTTGAVTGGASVNHTLGTTATDYTQTFSILGTASEVTVAKVGADIVLGLPDNVNVTNDLVVGGNLTVQGTTTTLNTTELLVEDNIVTLNSGVTGTPTLNSGIEIERGTLPNTAVLWNEATDRWTFSNNGTDYFNIPIPAEYTAYQHPTQTAITVDGSGLQFVQDVTVNSLGHTTAVVLGTIPSASESGLGVVQMATLADHTDASSTELVTNPAGVQAMINAALVSSGASAVYKTTITPADNSTTPIPHNLNTMDVTVEVYDTATGQTVLADVIRAGLNTVNITVGRLGTTTNMRVIVRKA